MTDGWMDSPTDSLDVRTLLLYFLCRVKYATGDLEQLNIDELIVDGHVYVRKQ